MYKTILLVLVSISLVQAWLLLDLHFTSVQAGTGEAHNINYHIYNSSLHVSLIYFLSGVVPYDSKFMKDWSTIVREIHDWLKGNFLLILSTVNILIGLMMIILSLLIGLVLWIPVALFRVTRKVKLLRKGLAFLRVRAVEGFTHRKSDPMQFVYSKK